MFELTSIGRLAAKFQVPAGKIGQALCGVPLAAVIDGRFFYDGPAVERTIQLFLNKEALEEAQANV